MLDTATMPVAAQTRVGRPGDPCVMVIFGAAGDLTRRKLVPALYNLARNQLLSREFAVLGIAHSSMSEEEFRKKVVEDVRQYTGNDGDPDLIEWFIRHMYYVTGEFEDKNIYPQLKSHLAKIDKEHSTHGNYFFYLATAPNFFGPIVEQLSAAGLMEEDGQHWRRVIIEKPFGHDLESARALNQQLLKVCDEKQIYRIDHYLGKETVQNILALRFANGIFEPVWNRRYIDHIQISVAETVGVEKRGGYYDKAGALRDMVPNHIMQLISLTAMEPPASFRAHAVRGEAVENLMPNQLVLHIQPDEGIYLRFAAKVPGPAMRLGAVDMNFEYSDYFGSQPSTGYERLLHDCMIGDATLFLRADMVEAGWCVVSPVLDVWKALPPRNFPNYATGTWGPKEADDLLERDGRRWRNFEK